MNDDGLVRSTFIAVFFMFALLLIIISLMSIPLRTRASSNTLTLKIKVQGNRKALDQLKSRIDFYNGPNKAYEEQNALFTYKDGAFVADVVLKNDFNFSDRYALFIKPDKFVGRIFCSTMSIGASCSSPQFFFLQSGTTIDLSEHLFYTGDVPPANGKVDAGDMSTIMKQLGKMNTASDSPTDLNTDGITDVTDYSLALYALTNNAADDPINLGGTPSVTPTSSATPSATPAITATTTPSPAPSVTLTPTPTTTPTTAPTATPTPVATAKCHLVPPAGYGDPFDLEPGKTSECGCDEAPLIGQICSTITCKTCPSGTCTCNISGTKMPTYTDTCTNGGSFSVNKVSKCN